MYLNDSKCIIYYTFRRRSEVMKQYKSREELIGSLSKFIPIILEDNNKVDEISSHLDKKHNITLARLMYFFNDLDRLNEAETSELALIADQISLKLEEADELSIDHWFKINEIKEVRQFYHVDESSKDKIELPLVLKNVILSGNNKYFTVLDYKTIARLYKYDLLNYNFEIQREGRLKKVGDEVIQEMKIYKKNVEEIKNRVLANKQEDTLIVYNCAVLTSEDESEKELIYDEKEMTLMITKGTRIDILDGAHRTMGIYEAYLENPDIEGSMPVQFSNRSTAEAREFQVELAKATPFNKARAKELAQERPSDELVNRLKFEGMLKGRISSTNTVNRKLNQLTTSSVLSDAFEKHWKPERRRDIDDVLKKFNEYLDYLFDDYSKYVDDTHNLLFSKLFFVGHVILAKKMFENDKPYNELYNVLDNIDFNKDNPMWKELNIVSEKSNPSEGKIIKNIEKYFKELL